MAKELPDHPFRAPGSSPDPDDRTFDPHDWLFLPDKNFVGRVIVWLDRDGNRLEPDIGRKEAISVRLVNALGEYAEFKTGPLGVGGIIPVESAQIEWFKSGKLEKDRKP